MKDKEKRLLWALASCAAAALLAAAVWLIIRYHPEIKGLCLLYTSDAADE